MVQTSVPPDRFGAWATVASLAIVSLAAGGCAMSGGVAPSVTPAMVAAAHGTSERSLRLGRQIYAGPCTSCHSADPIKSYSLGEWDRILKEMAPKAKLDDERRAAVTAYIQAAHALP